MYEAQTYQAILQRMLNRVPNNVDKREGSVVFDALAPAAAELAQMYIELDINYNLSFADTATGDDLTRRASEFGVNRYPATRARRKGVFFDGNNNLLDVPLGGRYSIQGVNYVVLSKISLGTFTLECETAGAVGNQQFGTLLPIDFVPDLARAELQDVLVPGQDQESDAALRERYYTAINEPAFGGNISDYKHKINSMDGVGGTKVFPTWQGGGTVKCTIIGSDWLEPSPELINQVQTEVDPTVNSGQGMGTAPIGHKVTITGVQGQMIDIETTVSLQAGTTVGQVQQDIEDAIQAYFLELRQAWANEEQTTVRVSQIDSRILAVAGVEDVTDTKLNGSAANIVLDAESVPKLRTVLIHE